MNTRKSRDRGVQYLNLAGNPGTQAFTEPHPQERRRSLRRSLCPVPCILTPEDIQIYGALTAEGWSTSIFSDLPHTGGIALDCEPEKVEKLQKLLWEILEARKQPVFKRPGSAP